MIEFKSKVRSVLLADPVLAPKLAWSYGPTRDHRAVYLNHLSHFTKVNYPAISIYWESGSDQHVVFAMKGQLWVDIWVWETPSDPGTVRGLEGAYSIYYDVRRLLHRQHLTALLHSAPYWLVNCTEQESCFMEDFDEEQKLYHVASKYTVELAPTGAEEAVPN